MDRCDERTPRPTAHPDVARPTHAETPGAEVVWRDGGDAIRALLSAYATGECDDRDLRAPIEAVAGTETIGVPEEMVSRRDTYVLRVR